MGKCLSILATFFCLFTSTVFTPTLKATSMENLLKRVPSTKAILENNMDCREQDSLVLVELYQSTNANGWTNDWDLSQPMDTWYGVTLNAEGCVEVLDLDGNTDVNCPACWGGGNNLTDTIPISIWNLVHLKNLSFSGNYPTVLDSLPSFIDNLSLLEILSLPQLQMAEGNIPVEIGNLSNLKVLLLFGNRFIGNVPATIGNLVNLQHLGLQENQLSGSLPTTLSNLVNLTNLDISNNQITTIPDLSSLSALKELFVQGNPLGGTIPNWLGNLTNLEFTVWAYCQLEGSIPDFWNGFNNLFSLHLYGNNLTGTIPSSLANTSLQYLSLAENQLTGAIPTELTNLSTLLQIDVTDNQLDGMIPDFSTSTNLQRLAVKENQLTFEDILPNFNAIETLINNNTNPNDDHNKYQYQTQNLVGTPTSINFLVGEDYTFDLGIDAAITDNVYKWYKNGILLQTNTGNNTLILNNATTADIGTYICEITNPNISDLTLESHPYRLSVIDPNCRMKDSLVLVDLYNATNGANWTHTWDLNQPMTTWFGITLNIDGCVEVVDLDGNLDVNCPGCWGGGNNLNGTLPTTFWNLVNLTTISFGGNTNLQMVLPAAIGNLVALKVLTLSIVNLSEATIPLELGDLSQLNHLLLNGTGLTGAIPSSLNNLGQLEALDLGNNQLTSLPDLSSLTNLINLTVAYNPFNTTIPTWFGNLVELVILDLRNNGWTGSIPPSIGTLPKLTQLYLADNELTGIIPNSFNNLETLVFLFLQNNQLTGGIPASLEGFNELALIDFSNNDFAGLIPNFAATNLQQQAPFLNNQFTFKDILPNLVANSAKIAENGGSADNFIYAPQQKIGETTAISFVPGNNYNINLNIDNFITSNVYTWYKDGNAYQTVNGNANLAINNAMATDVGVYTCEVTNPNAPNLTLESYSYTLLLVDTECRMQDSLVLVDLYTATGGANWNNTWDLSQPIDTWYGVTLNQSGCVIGLDLDGEPNNSNCLGCGFGNNLVGIMPTNLWDLDNLIELSLAGNMELNGALPTTINNLTNLTLLNFRDANLSGTIPVEIGDLVLLTHLNLSSNNLSGEIPSSINNLSLLTVLNLSFNQFSVIANLSGLGELLILELSYNPFNQQLPEWIGSLTKLTTLGLRGSGWTGYVPPTFSNLQNLNNLYLDFNQLKGDLPFNFNALNLSQLFLDDNQLTGTIASVIGSMDNISYANLSRNQFTDVVPNFANFAPYAANIFLQENQLTFEDILPNIAVNLSHIQNNDPNGQFIYAPQAQIGVTTSFLFNPGDTYTFDLDIDENITDNVYKWYKDGNLVQTITGNNQLVLSNVTTNDIGRYTCEVTNSGAPNLTLFSASYSLVQSIPGNDNICNATFLTIGTSVEGTLVGASNQANEPTVAGNNCIGNWCNSNLNGSVWYAFTAPTNPYVSIKTTNADTKIALYADVDCGASNPFENATLIAANDHVEGQCCGGFINLACLNAGSLYFIQVEQGQPNQGDFDIIMNQYNNCELPCDLMLTFSNVEPMSCPGSNDAIIRAFANSASGHRLVYDLYDNNNQLLRTELTGDIFGLSAGTYSVTARSLDNANCTLDLGTFDISNDVDNTVPAVNCINGTQNVAYVRGSNGHPWSIDSYTAEMDSVFANTWQEFTYGSVNPQLLFSDAYHFIYLEGNDNGIGEFMTFMNTNRQLIEDWVALGNSLLINASNYGADLYEIGFGGVTIQGGVAISSVTTTNSNHPIFVGPSLPTSTTLGGYSFAHAIIDASAINATPLLEASNGADVLVEATWGNGTVFFGGMTGTAFHFPSQEAEAFNVKANLLAYLAGEAIPAANTPIQLAIDENQTTTGLTVAMLDAGTFDNCELTNLQLNQTTFDCSELGNQLVILTATDASGNTSTCATPVLVTDLNDNCPIALNDSLAIITECPAEATLGQAFTIDITTQNFNSIIGTTFYICWDTAVLSFMDVTNQIDGTWLLGESLAEEGALIPSFLSTDFTTGTNYPDGTVLFSITFLPKSVGTGTTQIEYCTADPRPGSNAPAEVIVVGNDVTTIDFPSTSENQCAPITIIAPNNTGDCQNEWVINDSPIIAGTYAAATTITSAGTISNNTTVVFKAGESITLQAGFHAQAGSDFTAMIEACTPTNTLEETATERTQVVTTTGINTPTDLQLKAYPNPFNETATVDYYLPKASQTIIRLMDFMGKEVQVVRPLQQVAVGWHQVQLEAGDLPTGTYFVVLQNEGALTTRKLLLVN